MEAVYRHLFYAGRIRDYNITKKKWVLNGATVLYGSATELRATLNYDFSEEKTFSYKNITMDEIIHHLAVFVSRLWQIHVFGEGNTRTTAVFFIKYFRTLGFDVAKDIFAENAWYFRDSLVRANYNDLKNGIHETTEYVELSLRSLLLNESNHLHNRTLHISNTFKEAEKVNIDSKKANIEDVFTVKTASHIQVLQAALGSELVFGRSDVQRVLGLKPTEALRCCAKWQNMESLSQCPDMEKVSIDSGIRKVETMEFQTCSVRPKSY